jgi:hypothetical protein
MAKIYSPPQELAETPDFFPIENWQQREQEWVDKMREWCLTNGSGDLCGEIVREGVGDGYAQYMVFKSKPLTLIHLPIGDAWNFQWANKWNLKDIKGMVERNRNHKRLFGVT